MDTTSLLGGHHGPVRRAKGRGICQALGCRAIPAADGVYCRRKHLCDAHLKADTVQLPGHGAETFRFCFQCGRLQPASEFDPKKRTCRAALQKRRSAPRRRSGAAARAQESPSAGAMDAAPDGAEPPLRTASPFALAACAAEADDSASPSGGCGAAACALAAQGSCCSSLVAASSGTRQLGSGSSDAWAADTEELQLVLESELTAAAAVAALSAAPADSLSLASLGAEESRQLSLHLAAALVDEMQQCEPSGPLLAPLARTCSSSSSSDGDMPAASVSSGAAATSSWVEVAAPALAESAAAPCWADRLARMQAMQEKWNLLQARIDSLRSQLGLC